jgi:hypothetical protein
MVRNTEVGLISVGFEVGPEVSRVRVISGYDRIGM